MSRSMTVDFPDPIAEHGLWIYITAAQSAGSTRGGGSGLKDYKLIEALAPSSWTLPIDVLALWDSRYPDGFAAGDRLWLAVKYVSADGVAGPLMKVSTIAT